MPRLGAEAAICLVVRNRLASTFRVALNGDDCYDRVIHSISTVCALDTNRDTLVLLTKTGTAGPFGPGPQTGALAMTITRFSPPLDYLQAASRASLQSFELTRLNHAANLRQEIAVLIDQWIQETSEAMLARWMLDHHKLLRSVPMTSAELVRTLVDPSSSLFPESPSSIPNVVPAPPRFADPRSAAKHAIARKSQKPR